MVVNTARYMLFGFACVFAAGVTAQILIAGMAIFSDADYWYSHIVFVRALEFVPIAMLVFSVLGKCANGMRWRSALLFLLVLAQYFTANVPGAGAVHPILAAVLFWLSISTARNAGKLVFAGRPRKR